MKRRYWPVLLAVASFLVFGSYIAYSQLLMRLIKTQAEVHTRVYSLVQREINSPDQQEYLTTLADMQITLADNALDLTTSDKLYLLDDRQPATPRILTSKRVGVDYAGEWKDALLRFYDADSKAVSKVRRGD